MRVLRALSVEGSDLLSVQCYGVFLGSDIDIIRDVCEENNLGKDRVFFLKGDDWVNGVVLSEVFVKDAGDLAGVVARELSWMFSIGPCKGAFCMFDGAFGEYLDVLNPLLSDQTYAVSMSLDEPVIVLDDEFRNSDAWRGFISRARDRVGEFLF